MTLQTGFMPIAEDSPYYFGEVRSVSKRQVFTNIGYSQSHPEVPITLGSDTDLTFFLETDDFSIRQTGTSTAYCAYFVRWQGGGRFSNIPIEISNLKNAAETGDEAKFVQAVSEINWEICSASNHLQAIKFALQAGAHMAARKIAFEGSKRFPDNKKLQEYAHILAPPQVIQRDIPANPALMKNREWLKMHWNEYKGQWVALREGELLDSASNLVELQNLINRDEGIFFAKVA